MPQDAQQPAFERAFHAATRQLVGLWLAYDRQPDEAALARFTAAQSTLYLAQSLGLEGNYSRALALIPPPYVR